MPLFYSLTSSSALKVGSERGQDMAIPEGKHLITKLTIIILITTMISIIHIISTSDQLEIVWDLSVDCPRGSMN